VKYEARENSKSYDYQRVSIFFRSTLFKIFPVGVRGISSMKIIVDGILYLDSLSSQKFFISSSDTGTPS